MKLEVINGNYSAIIVEVIKVEQLSNCNNVWMVSVLWQQCILSLESKPWLYILFPTECQLSDEYCKNNNLYRDNGGYIEKSRRVRAQKFRGNISNWLLMPITSLSYLNIDLNEFKIWDEFQIIDWKEVCRKYEVPLKREYKIPPQKNFIWARVDAKMFPEHRDTANFFRVQDEFSPEDVVTITQKLHWTSVRMWNIRVYRKLKWWEKILIKLWVKIEKFEYDYIAWSRRVIKDLKSEREYNHFYNMDLYNKALNRFKHIIPKDTILYAEIIWWAGETPIQKWYTYEIAKWDFEVYIYRVVTINYDNSLTDWSFQSIKDYFWNMWNIVVPDFITDKISNIDLTQFKDWKYDWWVPVGDAVCDEWICIRREWYVPLITKAKNPLFLEHESSILDCWITDLETIW